MDWKIWSLSNTVQPEPASTPPWHTRIHEQLEHLVLDGISLIGWLYRVVRWVTWHLMVPLISLIWIVLLIATALGLAFEIVPLIIEYYMV